jgi:hypothetical protein
MSSSQRRGERGACEKSFPRGTKQGSDIGILEAWDRGMCDRCICFRRPEDSTCIVQQGSTALRTHPAVRGVCLVASHHVGTRAASPRSIARLTRTREFRDSMRESCT